MAPVFPRSKALLAAAALLPPALLAAAGGCASSGEAPLHAELPGRARPLSEVLQGCAVEPDGRRMRCGEVVLTVHEGEMATTFRERAEKKASDLLANATLDVVQVDVLGRKQPVERARIVAVYGDTHLSTLLFAGAGAGRAFTCEAPAADPGGVDRCVELIASYLAEAPVEEQAPAAASAPQAPRPGVDVAGRLLPLVEGCRIESNPPGGRLRCPFSVVVWRPFSTMEEAVAAALESTAAYRGVGNAVVEDQVECLIARDPGRCTRVTVEGEAAMSIVAGVAWVEGKPVAASCQSTAPIEGGDVCGGVVLAK